MKNQNGNIKGTKGTFFDGGVMALYTRREDGNGQLVSVLNLSAPANQPEAKGIGILMLQKLERVMRVMKFDTSFVHYTSDITPTETLYGFDTILQTTAHYWDCECQDGDYIHESSITKNGICARCQSEESECADSRIDEVFRKIRANFSHQKPVKVWRTDTQSGKREYFFGGFATRRKAEDAITDFHFYTNRLDETIAAEYRPNYKLSRNFISPSMWQIQEGDE